MKLPAAVWRALTRLLSTLGQERKRLRTIVGNAADAAMYSAKKAGSSSYLFAT
jgi:GGDEF domain-containing protein